MAQSGFTLVELLVVIAITSLISTVIVVRFSNFDSTILLKNLAYEIAVTLRETQVFSLSALGSDEGFDAPYGMSFSPNSKEYVFFQYINSDPTVRARNDSNAIDMNTFFIGRSLEVHELCVDTGGSNPDCTLSRLDISFRRPEFDAIFFAVDEDGSDWSETNNNSIISGEVKVHSVASGEVWVINVMLLGQITVTKEN